MSFWSMRPDSYGSQAAPNSSAWVDGFQNSARAVNFLGHFGEEEGTSHPGLTRVEGEQPLEMIVQSQSDLPTPIDVAPIIKIIAQAGTRQAFGEWANPREFGWNDQAPFSIDGTPTPRRRKPSSALRRRVLQL
jgi:hypothetical protein